MAKLTPLNPARPDYESTIFELLQQKPKVTQVNKLAGNSKYVPVSVVEDCLNWLFPLAWSFEITSYHVVMNEIVMVGCLTIHLGNREIKRAGTAAIMIQQSSGAAILDSSTKIKNALEKGFPKGKSECLKNAAKSLGPLFGSQLNKKLENEQGQKFDYESAILKDDTRILAQVQKANTLDDLKKLWFQISASGQVDSGVMECFDFAKERVKQNMIG